LISVAVALLVAGPAQPTAINDRGQVVGVSINALSQARGFLWTADTGMIDLGILGQIGPTSFSGARAINDRGHVVGRSFIAPPGAPSTLSSGRPKPG